MIKVSTLCYLVKEDEVLFLLRNKKEDDINEGFHIGLGGKLEKNETPGECVLREVKEEVDVELKGPKLRGIVNFPVKYEKSTTTSDYWITFLYMTEEWNGEIKKTDEGEIVWVKKDKIEDLNLWEGDKIFLDHLLNSQKFFVLDLIYDADKLIEHKIEFPGEGR